MALSLYYLKLTSKEKVGVIILLTSFFLFTGSSYLMFVSDMPDFSFSKLNLPKMKWSFPVITGKNEERMERPLENSTEHYQVGKDLDAGIYFLEVPERRFSFYYYVYNQSEDKLLLKSYSSHSRWLELKENENLYLTKEVKVISQAEQQAKITPQTSYREQAYYVGVDIPAGEYYVEKQFSYGHIRKFSDLRIDDAVGELKNLSYDNDGYIQLSEGESIDTEWVELYPVAENKQGGRDYKKESGMYKVGTEIPAGSYYITDLNEESNVLIYQNGVSFESERERRRFRDAEYSLISLKEGEYVDLTHVKLDSIEKAPKFVNASKLKKETFLVGATIDSGWYQVIANLKNNESYANYEITYPDNQSKFYSGVYRNKEFVYLDDGMLVDFNQVQVKSIKPTYQKVDPASWVQNTLEEDSYQITKISEDLLKSTIQYVSFSPDGLYIDRSIVKYGEVKEQKESQLLEKLVKIAKEKELTTIFIGSDNVHFSFAKDHKLKMDLTYRSALKPSGNAVNWILKEYPNWTVDFREEN